MTDSHSYAILSQFIQNPLRNYFPIKKATSIVPISIKTNEIISVIRGFDKWWIDGIEIPDGFNWSDLTDFQLTFGGGTVDYNIPLKPILEMMPETIQGNFWRFPFNKLIQQSFPLIAIKYSYVKYKFKSDKDFEIKIYQGTSFLENNSRRILAEKEHEIKIRNISQPFLFQGNTLELNNQVNFISTGFLFHTQNELQKIKVSLDNYSLLEYNETMIKIYAKKLSKINYTKKQQNALKSVLDKYNVPNDILREIENYINNEHWYWIPFAPKKNLWKWDFTDLSVNMSRVENLKIEVEPVQKLSNIYFITYNIMLIINGMVGMKFS